jgi:hypothetical protein
MQDDEDPAKQQQLFESDCVPDEDLDTVMEQILRDLISTVSIDNQRRIASSANHLPVSCASRLLTSKPRLNKAADPGLITNPNAPPSQAEIRL